MILDLSELCICIVVLVLALALALIAASGLERQEFKFKFQFHYRNHLSTPRKSRRIGFIQNHTIFGAVVRPPRSVI
ncbi:hypothetical protein CPB83DRAFT_864744 [Crepidotus variabilis]|uniref:Uncharacterized protein n=1 Tax=Crepidotus variabilis TaxID=179855 RepID=A0A9P6E476_9AGAR|nr:hypothetical protein CPB83DRAFT_864744 [Crepidotus variabilis]